MLEIITFIKDYVLGFIILISILVFIHELGHYLFAKMFKVKVEAFSIGFGKEIFGWSDKSGTRWKICPIPFGGYVKMKGEMLEGENQNEINDPDSFNAKTQLEKFLIVFAGPLFNLILPFIILILIAFFSGVPSYNAKIAQVLDSSPAYNILQVGDDILKVDSSQIKDFSDLQAIVSKNPNETLMFEIKRNQKVISLKITIGNKKINKMDMGFLGVVADQSISGNTKYSFSESLSYSYSTYNKVFSLIIYGFQQLFIGNVTLDDIGGPIKIAQISGDSLHQGVSSWLFFMAMLSINLAIINLLPIPALDGGYLLLYIVQGVTRKKLNTKVQSILMQCGFAFLMFLMVAVIFKDILSLFL